MKHTKEPWAQDEYGNITAFCLPITRETHTANMSRAVACVNAMAGIRNPGAVKELIEAIRRGECGQDIIASLDQEPQ